MKHSSKRRQAGISFFGLVFVIAVLGKVAAGYSLPWRKDINKLAVGVGMVPRGEVGLIFAQIGLLGGVLTQDVFSAVLIMVMATTLVTPPFLKVLFGRGAGEGRGGRAATAAATSRPRARRVRIPRRLGRARGVGCAVAGVRRQSARART